MLFNASKGLEGLCGMKEQAVTFTEVQPMREILEAGFSEHHTSIFTYKRKAQTSPSIEHFPQCSSDRLPLIPGFLQTIVSRSS